MKRRSAKGTADEFHAGFKAIAVRFDDKTFERIGTEAQRRGIAFAEMVRTYVGLGMGVDRELSDYTEEEVADARGAAS